MSEHDAVDPVGELVQLARAAAEAGVDWRSRLREVWLPATVAHTPRAALAAALSEWDPHLAVLDADLAAELESAVLAFMAEEGYD
jgi:hypothetical protein